MPEKATIERAREDAREGKAASTQAGEFVREEIHHVREGKHGARNPKQAIAIGLSKARKAGVKVPAAPKGSASRQKKRSHRSARKSSSKPSAKRSAASKRALKREGKGAASHGALSAQARSASRRRSRASRSGAARKAARTRSRERARSRR
jgi:hypothetical protein